MRTAQLRTVAFQYLNGSAKFAAAARNSQTKDPGRPDRHETDAAISSIPQEDPNALLGTITETISTSPAYVADRLRNEDFTLDSPRADLEADTGSFTISTQLLPKLCPHAHNDWRHLATGDESWFYYEYVRDRIWTARDQNTS
jgi:hypothetical protein